MARIQKCSVSQNRLAGLRTVAIGCARIAEGGHGRSLVLDNWGLNGGTRIALLVSPDVGVHRRAFLKNGWIDNQPAS